MVFRKRRRESEEAFALYYASDVHGSDQCWRKFLGAGRFYEVNALIMGGDLTGKAIVPIQLDADGAFTAEFLGETRSGRGETSLTELTEARALQRHVPVGRERGRDRAAPFRRLRPGRAVRAGPARRAATLGRARR